MKIVFESQISPEIAKAFIEGYEHPERLPEITYYTRADLERLLLRDSSPKE